MRLSSLLLLLATIVGCGKSAHPGSSGDGSGGDNLDLAVTGTTDGFGGCATATFQAMQAPAAMLVLLDRSQSMQDANKYVFAAQATVQALDGDVFDSMSLGLMAAPSSKIAGPACFGGLFDFACGVPAFPQVDIKAAGTLKSTDNTGVRHDIKEWFKKGENGPDPGPGDATPMYSAMQAAIGALQGVAKVSKRILFVVTDGSWSCTSYSKRPAYADCNAMFGCDPDWEKPQNAVTLVSQANKDANAPVETFIVGVPGADTYDKTACNYPPYAMRAGLSAIAYAGSPTNAPVGCTGKVFNDDIKDPAVSCHFDMTQGGFNAQRLADAITQIRGKVLGCAFELPVPDGGMVNKDEVNVTITVAGVKTELYRRRDAGNLCIDDGCWDYDQNGKVVLIGKACDQVGTGTDVKVEIVVGCATVIG